MYINSINNFRKLILFKFKIKKIRINNMSAEI